MTEAVHYLVERAVEDKRLGITGQMLGYDDSYYNHSGGGKHQPLQGWLPSTDITTLLERHPGHSSDRPNTTPTADNTGKQANGTQEPHADPAWAHFAGSIGREDAERLLR